MLLLAAIGALGGISILLCSWHRFELSITLILVSPWMGWLLSSNAARTVEEEGVTGAASYIRILLVLLVGCCGMLQFLRSWFTEQTKCIPKYLIFFALFIVYAILSAGYSLDRKFTLIRSFEFLIFFMFLLGFHFWLNNRPKLDTTLNIYYWMIVIGMILNAAALILMPQLVWDWKRPDRFQGLTDHPNMFGALCMLSYPILAWKYTTSRNSAKSASVILICITAGLHVLSGSRSSLLAAVIGGIVWLLLSVKSITLKRIAIGLIFGLTLTFSVSFLLMTKPTSFQRGDSNITALTGRTDFWKGCVLLIKEKPLQGYGFGVAGKVWEDPRFYKEGQALWAGSAKSSLHNGYLSLAIGLGVVGLGGWLIFVSIPTWQLMSLKSSPYKAFALAMIIQLLILNFAESALATGSQIYTSLIFWFILVIAGRLPKLLTPQTEHVSKTYEETNFGFINSTDNLAGLCAGHPSA
ncbi:MAG: O-antigen ligase family protein [Planctomycetota bacterium]